MSETRLDLTRLAGAFALRHDERTPTHTHDEGHLVYPATGVLSVATDAGVWIAPPNRVVWIPAHARHEHRAHGATDMRVVFVRSTLARTLPHHPSVLVMTALAREATLVLSGDDPRPDAARDRLQRVVLDEVAAAADEPLHLPEPADERLRAVAHLVEKDLAHPATLHQLGHRVGASERALSRLFHDETGMTFRQWRTQLRVHHALLSLADGKTVIDTAVSCGWRNPSAFIDAFTALVGQTPGQYQQAITRSRAIPSRTDSESLRRPGSAPTLSGRPTPQPASRSRSRRSTGP